MPRGRETSLTQQQQSDLSSIAQSRSLPAGYVFRAKLILMLAEGASFNAIKRQLQTTAPTIVRWKQRFRQHGLEGLDTYHPGQKPSVLTPALRARILSATRKKPSDGATHSLCRKLAAVRSSAFCKRSYPSARLRNRFTSSSTISPHTKLRRSAISSNNIRESGFTSRPLTRPGSTRSRSGLPRSNAR